MQSCSHPLAFPPCTYCSSDTQAWPFAPHFERHRVLQASLCFLTRDEMPTLLSVQTQQALALANCAKYLAYHDMNVPVFLGFRWLHAIMGLVYFYNPANSTLMPPLVTLLCSQCSTALKVSLSQQRCQGIGNKALKSLTTRTSDYLVNPASLFTPTTHQPFQALFRNDYSPAAPK